MAKAVNTDAVEPATGIAWAAWTEHLDGAGGPTLSHPELVAVARAHMAASVESPDWWAQMVTVAYEQHIGRRAPGQRADETFEPTASRSVAGDLDVAMGAWIALVEDRDDFGGVELAAAPTTSATDKYRRWRAPLEDGTRIGVDVGARGDRSVVTATWYKVADAASAEERKAWLKSLLAQMS